MKKVKKWAKGVWLAFFGKQVMPGYWQEDDGPRGGGVVKLPD